MLVLDSIGGFSTIYAQKKKKERKTSNEILPSEEILSKP